ncbi:carbon-monoxide dehydrogenase medium subunit [Rhodoligotrophos appendicifer]|uniref:FAD binding domain-containing protein n=1 Tax=Rhodoligotrophos appendicifer TaxID=987056 RepID=UPI00117D539A|nr:FAD binding domain-containing protein [Rhodoligotrophos appendicifer]
MKAAAFEYHRPGTAAEALDLAASLENAKFLAGGQSLVAMLNMRYAIVDHLIDLNRVADLAGISLVGNALRIGAMTRQKTLKSDTSVARRAPIFAAALDHVGHLQTRNRGTIGGSLGHMDPSAELLALAVLHDAVVEVKSRSAAREIAIADYPIAYMTPSIEPQEMITSVTFRLPAEHHGWGFHEFAQRHGDFAVVGVAALMELSDGKIARAAISLFGVGMAPVRLASAEVMLAGEAPRPELFEAAAASLDGVDFSTDAMASGAYRQRLARVLTRRALTDAARRGGQTEI